MQLRPTGSQEAPANRRNRKMEEMAGPPPDRRHLPIGTRRCTNRFELGIIVNTGVIFQTGEEMESGSDGNSRQEILWQRIHLDCCQS